MTSEQESGLWECPDNLQIREATNSEFYGKNIVFSFITLASYCDVVC